MARPSAASSTHDRSRGSAATTHGVRVEVHPRYLASHSITEPAPGESPRFVFSYRVRITNLGEASVCLRSRRWIIVDADGQRHEVIGEGVVGQQPRLDPGMVFEYESFCPLPTPWGTMEGFFSMEFRHGEAEVRIEEVRIERFYLAAPAG